ncbi:MAG: type I pullulanase [Sumerlaeia bacterium]
MQFASYNKTMKSLFMMGVVSGASVFPACAANSMPGEGAAEDGILTIHYHRYDGDYSGIGIWTWDRAEKRSPATNEVLPAGEDEFGKVFKIDTALYGLEGTSKEIGLIPRLRNSWDFKDGTDRFWNESLGYELWLVGNDPNMYTSAPDISPKIKSAKVDGDHLITVRFSHPVQLDGEAKDSVVVRYQDGALVSVGDVTQQDPLSLAIKTQEPLGVMKNLFVSMNGYKEVQTTMGAILFDANLFYSDLPMGAIYSPEKTTFRLFSPQARAAWVVLYDDRTGNAGREELALKNVGKGVWETTVAGDLKGTHYMVKVDADGPAANTEVVDIWSKANTGRFGRGMIVDLRELDPPGFRETPRPVNIEGPTDAIIWEVSLRDFTRDVSSGVPPLQRGKFKGAALRGTTVPGSDIKTGIDYLVDLGITHVQILPIQDFDNMEMEDEYNWGYMTTNFNSPDGWFASDARDASRVSEFKEVVQAFHKAGIRVILDVVYNHTAPNATFESIAPGYYHRFKADGSYWNGSGTGNEFNSEAPMARKFIVDSCRFWAEEYRIDGFRFDLMGLVDAETMVQVKDAVQAIDPTLLVYGEPWAAAESGLAQIVWKDVASAHGLGAFNDHFRNAIKGAPDGDEPGYVLDGRNRDGVISGLKGSVTDWAQEPGHALQYVTCHDNLSLWDKIVYSSPGATQQEIVRMNELSLGILAVSQGKMFLHAGSEFGYEKQMEHNSYNKPDSVNSIKWGLREANAGMEAFVRHMIELRKAHPIFRLTTKKAVEERLRFLPEPAGNSDVIVMAMKGEGLEGETWNQVLVIINPKVAGEFDLLPGNWVLQATNVNPQRVGTTVSGKLQLEAKEMVVLSIAN